MSSMTQRSIDMSRHVVTASTRHESAHLHVTGEAVYTDDIPLPRDALSAAIGYAPAAHAALKAVDLTAVRAAKGVVAVFTAADVPGVNNYGGIKLDDPILATDLIEYHGQPVFVVVAETHGLARKAARLARSASRLALFSLLATDMRTGSAFCAGSFAACSFAAC